MKNWNHKHLGLLACGFVLLAIILPGMAQQPKAKKVVPGLDPVKKSTAGKSRDERPQVIALKMKGSTTIPKIKGLAPAKVSKAPKPLSSAQRLDLLKTGGGVTIAAAGTSASSFLKLTPREPFAGQTTGWIDFSQPAGINTNLNLAGYDSSGDGRVNFNMKPPVAGRYLIEFGVSGENQTFTLNFADQGPPQTISGVTAGRPVVFLLDAIDTNFYYVDLSGSQGTEWQFHYVEVTQLK